MHQDDAPVCEFQGIVMNIRPVHIDLPEAGHRSSRFLPMEKRPALIEFDFLFECDFGARKQANCNVPLIPCRKTVCRGIDEPG
jgi:hypothetical protein